MTGKIGEDKVGRTDVCWNPNHTRTFSVNVSYYLSIG